MNLKAYLSHRQALINWALEGFLPRQRLGPGPIHRAMRYSVLGEGKRIRPILALAACEAVGGKLATALPAACALELIHAYSLVHDDLPAMDNDDFRRGKPSCHKRFGEAIGILTGDALLTYSFELLTRGNHVPSARLRVIREIARAIGTEGMIGGQVADVVRVGGGVVVAARGEVGVGRGAPLGKAPARLDRQAVEYINRRKTGALISASVRVGALLGGASDKQYRALARYGDRVGLVFQLVDDLLDGDGAVRIEGESRVRARAERLTRSAISALGPIGRRADRLKQLAEFILRRKS